MCGAGSGALHLAVYFAQRTIQRGPNYAAGQFWSAVTAYELATCGLFILYVLVLTATARHEASSPTERRLIILIPVAFTLALGPTLPALSIDVYSYVAYGYVQARLGQSPYVVGARAVASTTIGPELAAYGWRPVHTISPYGPVVEHLNHAVVRITQNVLVEILLLKCCAVAATLGAAALIWSILRRVNPRAQLLGTAAFLWNPAIIWELA